jgi:hypothetical protein
VRPGRISVVSFLPGGLCWDCFSPVSLSIGGFDPSTQNGLVLLLGLLAKKGGRPHTRVTEDAHMHYSLKMRSRVFIRLFNGLTSGSLSMSAHIKFSLSAQHLQVGPTYQIWCQFAFNSRSLQITNNYPKSDNFLRLKHKIMVFQNFIFNIVVLC